MADALLTVENLICTRGDRQLFTDLNFTVNRGDVLHITGPNGCGKTSLLRLLAGLLLAETGKVYWYHQPIAQALDYKKNCCFIGHKPAVKQRLSVLENIQLQCRIFFPARVDHEKLVSSLAYFNLSHLCHVLGQSLSAGQRQRLALTRLIIGQAPLWLLDEPFTALDTQGIERMHQLMRQHVNNGGSIILSSHQPITAETFAVNTLELA